MKPLSELKYARFYKNGLQSGVYYLIHKEEVVYVGQTININRRIRQHQNKKFNKILFEPFSIDELNPQEKIAIDTYKPKYNTSSGTNKPYYPKPGRKKLPDSEKKVSLRIFLEQRLIDNCGGEAKAKQIALKAIESHGN